MYDVAVVGGGPVGSYVAYKLAERGHRVVVLERKLKPGEKACCTGIIGQECARLFNIREVILRRINCARLFSPSGSSLRLWREETQACVVDRTAFDRAIAGWVQEKGGEYVLASPVEDIAVKTDRVELKVYGQETKFEARAAVIASGFGSRLGEKLGLGEVGDFTLGAQVEVAAEADEVEVYFGRGIAPGFFGWMVPSRPGMARVGLMSRRQPGLYLRKLLAALRAQGKIASTETEPAYGGIPLKPLPRTYGRRVIAVGDAAGQVKPTTGGGIYYGLLCAEIAADDLHRALEDDDLSARRLAGYERAWKRKLGWELRVGYWARKLFERLSDAQIDRLFEMVKANGIDEALLKEKDLSFDWHGRAILSLLKHKVVSKAMDVMRVPFRNGRD